jgi:hypothetical protein
MRHLEDFEDGKTRIVRERTHLTRNKGKKVVEKLFAEKENTARKAWLERDRANDTLYGEQIAPHFAAYEAAIATFRATHDRIEKELQEEWNAEYKILQKQKERAFALLEARCWILVGNRECGKYLDYEGNCPTHGHLELPGE